MTIVNTVNQALPHPLVETADYRIASAAAEIAFGSNAVVAFDGEPGTGKSTFLLEFGRAHSVPAVYCTVSDKATPKDAVLSVLEAVTGVHHNGTRTELERILLGLLVQNPVAVLCDEIQYTGKTGFRTLKYLWDEVLRRTGTAFPLLLCGYGIGSSLATVPELASRLTATVYFEGPTLDEQIAFAKSLHPAIGALSDKDLISVSQALAETNFRAWHNFAVVVGQLHQHQPTLSPTQLSSMALRLVPRKP